MASMETGRRLVTKVKEITGKPGLNVEVSARP
jgi:hypothetical protein